MNNFDRCTFINCIYLFSRSPKKSTTFAEINNETLLGRCVFQVECGYKCNKSILMCFFSSKDSDRVCRVHKL